MIVLAGRRGWIKPRKDMTGRFWRRSGIQIARRPKIHLAISLVILVSLASCTLLVNYNYDDRKTLPPDTPSNRGYTAMDAHFPVAGTCSSSSWSSRRQQTCGPRGRWPIWSRWPSG